MLIDMNAIQTQLSARTHGRTNININSKRTLGIKIPKNNESPFSSDKSGGILDLAMCKSSCAEYIFEGVLDSLSYILHSANPATTQTDVAAVLNKLQQGSKQWNSVQNEKENSNVNGFYGGAKKGKFEWTKNTHLKSVDDDSDMDDEDSNEILKNEAKDGSIRASLKNNEKNNSKKSANSDGNNDVNNDDRLKRRGSKGGGSIELKQSKIDGNRELKNKNNNQEELHHELNAENNVQLAECVIILFDTFIAENSLLLHTPSYSPFPSTSPSSSFSSSSLSLTHTAPGEFNLPQCDALLNLCIGVSTMLLALKSCTNVPDRLDKVSEIMKSLINHLFELKLKYTILKSNSDCSDMLCRTALVTSVRATINQCDPSQSSTNTNNENTMNSVNTDPKLNTISSNYNLIENNDDDSEDENGNFNGNGNGNGNGKYFGKKSQRYPKGIRNDFKIFCDDLEYHPPVSSIRIIKSPLFTVLHENLISATHYLECGGPVLVDIDGNSVVDMGGKKDIDEKLLKLSAFELWMNGGARILTTALGLIANTPNTSTYLHNEHENKNNHKNNKNSNSNGGNYNDNNNNNNNSGIKGLGSRYHREVDGPVEVSSTLLHLFIQLLQNDVENIRKKNENVNTRSIKVTKELERISRYQNALHILGASSVVLRLLGKSHSMGRAAALTSPIPPLALKLGAYLASRNIATQNAILDSYQLSLHECIGQKESTAAQIAISINGIQRLLKIARAHIDLVRVSGAESLNSSTLKILVQIFHFCGMLCSGHNGRSRHFLRDQQFIDCEIGDNKNSVHDGRGNYDIVREIALASNSLLSAANSMMKYVTNAHFNETLAPLIWEANKTSGRRKFIAWHDTRVDYFKLAQLIHTAAAGFQCLAELVQGPCIENQKSVLLSVTKCPSLLEYLGTHLIFLNTFKLVL